MDLGKKHQTYNFVPERQSNLQNDLDEQRYYYRMANLKNDFEVMVKCLENIKSEIKAKARAIGNIDKIDKVEAIINWYKTLPLKYSKRTEEGYKVCYPMNISITINTQLNEAYEILIEQLVKLNLI